MSGKYNGLGEGDAVGRFPNAEDSKSNLYISYRAGNGNDISLSTKSSNINLDQGNDKPPAASSLFFSAIFSEASVKENKNGNFLMEMKVV